MPREIAWEGETVIRAYTHSRSMAPWKGGASGKQAKQFCPLSASFSLTFMVEKYNTLFLSPAGVQEKKKREKELQRVYTFPSTFHCHRYPKKLIDIFFLFSFFRPISSAKDPGSASDAATSDDWTRPATTSRPTPDAAAAATAAAQAREGAAAAVTAAAAAEAAAASFKERSDTATSSTRPRPGVGQPEPGQQAQRHRPTAVSTATASDAAAITTAAADSAPPVPSVPTHVQRDPPSPSEAGPAPAPTASAGILWEATLFLRAAAAATPAAPEAHVCYVPARAANLPAAAASGAADSPTSATAPLPRFPAAVSLVRAGRPAATAPTSAAAARIPQQEQEQAGPPTPAAATAGEHSAGPPPSRLCGLPPNVPRRTHAATAAAVSPASAAAPELQRSGRTKCKATKKTILPLFSRAKRTAIILPSYLSRRKKRKRENSLPPPPSISHAIGGTCCQGKGESGGLARMLPPLPIRGSRAGRGYSMKGGGEQMERNFNCASARKREFGVHGRKEGRRGRPR